MIAERLREAADLLALQGANPFRANAYRRAADTVETLDRRLIDVVQREGLDGLVQLQHIGWGIARAIEEMFETGSWSLLDRLRGSLDPEKLFQTVPGIGPVLARRIHDRLGIDTLEALEVAAHDGRLAKVRGIGARRVASVRASLATMLRRGGRPRFHRPIAGPPVATLLDVDRDYREGVRCGLLPTIAPRRFNPEGRSWLPILHTERAGWHLTALFSNTARAHELGRTRDWVVIYCYDDDHEEGQHTVVTKTRGPLVGRRVVRSREAECREYYDNGRPNTSVSGGDLARLGWTG